MRLVEVRLLDGPNVYRLEPTVKIELAVGRRRSWFGQRMPSRHALVQLGAPVAPRLCPEPVVLLAAWVRRLHQLTGAAEWLRSEPDRDGRIRRSLPVTIHRTSEPGHWVVAYPWREQERAQAIADGAWRLAERGADPVRTVSRSTRRRALRSIGELLERIREAGTTPPEWLRDDRRRVPIVSITGTNGKSTTTRMITQIMRTSGKRVGTTTSDGVLYDGRLIEEGDYTGPSGAKRVLQHPDVEVAVLETARGGILLRGLGYESNDASVITNVSADHLDLLGLHTLPELAEVKSVITKVTKPTGTVVLNADDRLVSALARRVSAPVCFFSLQPRSALVQRHLAAGGKAMLFEDGWLVEAEGRERHRLMPASDAPATLLGLARHNVANALAAAGAARALGVDRETVAAGLREYRPTAEQAPGRVNLYRVGQRLVIVDFAHNEAGISVVLDLAEAIAGPRERRRRPLTVIVGAAGDRPDDTLRGIGRIVARRADRVGIKETLKYLRGRSRESAVGELLAGMVEGGAKRSQVPVYEDEPIALRAVLSGDWRAQEATRSSRKREPRDGAGGDGHLAAARARTPALTAARGAQIPQDGEVIVLTVHADRQGVREVLGEFGAQPIDAASGLQEFVPQGFAGPAGPAASSATAG